MNHINSLLQRFSQMESAGAETYFDAHEIVELLDYFEQKDDFEHYEKLLDFGTKLHPENSDIKIRRSRICIARGDYMQALRLIERSGETGDLELQLLRMECLCALERYDEILAFVRQHEIQSGSQELQEIYENIVPMMNEAEKYTGMEALILRGMKLFPRSLTLREEYCYFLEKQGQIRKALNVCSELLDADPYSSDYWYIHGKLCLTLGHYEKAVDSFDFALTCDDSDTEIKVLKSYCLFMNESYDRAIEVYLELISGEHSPEQLEPEQLFTESGDGIDRYEQACAIINQLLQESSTVKGISIYRNYMRRCIEKESLNEARQMPLQTSAHIPEDLILLLMQVFAHLVKGEESEAAEITDQALLTLSRQCAKRDSTPVVGKIMLYVGESIKEIFEGLHSVISPKELQPYMSVYRAVEYMLDGEIQEFSKKYSKLSPEITSGYFHLIFSVIRRNAGKTRPGNGFLLAEEIRMHPREQIKPEYLGIKYLTDKYHNN